MPRGVAVADVRQRLFAAAERIVLREGPAKVTGRAVTAEAGVATGLLHAHFGDVDGFLTAYTVDRSFLMGAAVGDLSESVGSGTISGNLSAALMRLPAEAVPAVAALLVLRPDLAPEVGQVLGPGAVGLLAVETAVRHYLGEEQRIGRLSSVARPEALAMAIAGVLQQAVLAHMADDGRERAARITGELLAPVVRGTAQRTPQE